MMASMTGSRGGTTSPKAIHADLEHISFDPALTGKIMKKRQEEMRRRTKLLDPRKRQYGVEHTVLDAQVAENRALREGDAGEEAFHARTQAMVDEVLQTIEGAKLDAQREREKATKDFSLTNLKKEDRREYYLSDPNNLKNEAPIP